MVGNQARSRIGIRTVILFILVAVLAVAPVSAKSKKPKKLYLQATSTTVDIGGKVKVSVKKVSPKKASKSVKWKSSNKKVATVNKSGYVTGRKKGTVTITATSTKSRKAHKKIRIKVSNLKATSVKVNKSSVQLAVQERVNLKATVKGKTGFYNQGVTWKSSDRTVAVVDSKGNVTGTGNGEAVITATERGGTKKATCKITVFQTVTPKELWNNLKTGKYTILDLRLTAGTNSEVGYEEGHLPTALNCSVAKDFADKDSIEAKSGEENIQDMISRHGTEQQFVLIGDGGRYEKHARALLQKSGVPKSGTCILSSDGKMSGNLGMTAWTKIYPDYVVKEFNTGSWSFKDTITEEQLQRDMNGQKLYTIIDARAKEQYDLAHAPGAWNAPCRAGDNRENPKTSILNREERKDNFREVVKANPDAIYVVICYSGTRYSNNAKETLVQDYNVPEERIIIQQGGMGSWTGDLTSTPEVDAEKKQVTVAAIKNPELDLNPSKKCSHFLTNISGEHHTESVLQTYVTPAQIQQSLEKIGAKDNVQISLSWDDFTQKGSGSVSNTLDNFSADGKETAFNVAEGANLETGCLINLTGCVDGLLQPNAGSGSETNYSVKKGTLPTSEHDKTQDNNPDEKNVVYITFSVK